MWVQISLLVLSSIAIVAMIFYRAWEIRVGRKKMTHTGETLYDYAYEYKELSKVKMLEWWRRREEILSLKILESVSHMIPRQELVSKIADMIEGKGEVSADNTPSAFMRDIKEAKKEKSEKEVSG